MAYLTIRNGLKMAGFRISFSKVFCRTETSGDSLLSHKRTFETALEGSYVALKGENLELDHLSLSLLVTTEFEVLASLDDQKLSLLRLKANRLLMVLDKSAREK
jgi:hypothetical protein